jgi:hypothetical protein
LAQVADSINRGRGKAELPGPPIQSPPLVRLNADRLQVQSTFSCRDDEEGATKNTKSANAAQSPSGWFVSITDPAKRASRTMRILGVFRVFRG